MRSALVVVLDLFCALLVIRGVLSWFRLTPGSGWDRLRATAARFTEPILRPIRRVLPELPAIDVSAMVAFFGITLVVIPVIDRL